MTLTKVDSQYFRLDGEYIHFWMDDVGARVPCAVMREYLAARAIGVGIFNQSYRSLFIHFRKDVEALASQKYDRGIEHPVITVRDLKLSKLLQTD